MYAVEGDRIPPMKVYWLEMEKNLNPATTNRTNIQGLPSINKYNFYKYKANK